MKRHRQSEQNDAGRPPKRERRIIFLEMLSDEIIIQIISFLDVVDICSVQLVNHKFANLAKDPILWKCLYRTRFPSSRYAREFGQPHETQHRSQPYKLKRLGLITSSDTRRVCDTKEIDWKRRFKIRTNWSTGRSRCYTSALVPQIQEVEGKGHHIQNSTLQVDKVSSRLPRNLGMQEVYCLDTHTVLIIAENGVYLWNTVSQIILDKISFVRKTRTFVLHHVFATLDDRNMLTLYNVSTKIILIIRYLGLSSSESVLNMRESKNKIMIGLVCLDHSILESALRLQEIVISKSSRTILSTRTATSNGTIPRNCPSVMKTSLVYAHPYILLAAANYMYIYLVSSTVLALTIADFKVLWGYGSTIRTCHINSDLRLAIGSGDIGMRIWDLDAEKESIGVSIIARSTGRQDHTQMYRAAGYSGPILRVSETQVIAANESGLFTIHDFDS